MKKSNHGCQLGASVRDGRLRLPQSQVVAFLAVLNDAFERRIRHIGIAGLQQQKGGQNTAQAPVPILKGMDCQEYDDKYGDDQ